jgi:uncharacterized protein
MSETMSERAGKIAWFELPVENTLRAQSFFGRLFGRVFEPFEYSVAYGAGGAVQARDGQTGLLAYFGADDIAASVARVRELGGQAFDPEEIPGIGRNAHCTDTEGNPFGLYQAAGGP